MLQSVVLQIIKHDWETEQQQINGIIQYISQKKFFFVCLTGISELKWNKLWDSEWTEMEICSWLLPSNRLKQARAVKASLNSSMVIGRKIRFSFCWCCSVIKSCPTLCDPMNCNMPGFPVLHYLPEFAQTHVHWVDDAIQSSHPLLPASPLALNISQHQGLFRWVSSLYQVAKILELQL